MSRQLTKADLNEIITSMIKHQCNSVSKDADLYEFQYAVAYMDGVNDLGDRILDFMERKEKKENAVS